MYSELTGGTSHDGTWRYVLHTCRRNRSTSWTKTLGLRKVFPTSDSDNTTVDIIAIHGLDTESPRTWTYENGSRSVNWLKDEAMLPAAAPDARIYTYD
ncbi:hypothetical protein F5Y00DRAFT_192622 [Daldinia vernicosa]|uniref:uncharacterized protein n=1 Tax=Daldinia vernicosa TaxID=114800 RepID=UPI0020086B73|nr:uncharacterized protein F5Y00DRAFT_192622 [Daldinia vernicosa]KAI0852279.1 hypothetical protein F5Y00DRAFT_192622 [Daldinia vernicosa]